MPFIILRFFTFSTDKQILMLLQKFGYGDLLFWDGSLCQLELDPVYLSDAVCDCDEAVQNYTSQYIGPSMCIKLKKRKVITICSSLGYYYSPIDHWMAFYLRVNVSGFVGYYWPCEMCNLTRDLMNTMSTCIFYYLFRCPFSFSNYDVVEGTE